MTRGTEQDPLLAALRNARPALHDVEPDDELMARIIAGPRRTRRGGARWIAGAVAMVAAALALTLLVTQTGPRTVDIALVAARSQEALRGSGRAHVESVTDRGLANEQRWSNDVTFDGDDVEMVMRFAGDGRSTGFTAHNRTVDGEFYLLDGPPGRQRWIHDVGANATTRGTDLFSLDPRTLCELLKDSAEFERVNEHDGVKHLRATEVNDLPPLSFGAGPSDARAEDVTRLELWVGPDDVVRRIDIDLERTERERRGAMSRITQNPDGTYTKEIDPAHPGTEELVTHRSSYSVRFAGIGDPVEIVAPAGAADVEGKG